MPRRPQFVLSALGLVALAAACGDDKPAAAPGVPSGATAPAGDGADLVRERVAAHLVRDERSRAREALRPLVEGDNAAIQDLLAAASIELADNQIDASRAFLDRAAKFQPKPAALHYLRGQLARNDGDSKTARELFRATLATAPNDLPTKLALAEAEDELDNAAEAERLYKEVVAVGPGNGAQWYVAAVNRLRNLLTSLGPAREAEAARLDPIIRSLEAREFKAPNTITVMLGELGRVRPPAPSGSHVAPVAKPLTFVAGAPFDLPVGATSIEARDVDGDLAIELVVRGSEGVAVLPIAKGAPGAPQVAIAGKLASPVAFDVDNDGDLDVFAIRPEGATLAVRGASAFAIAEAEWPELPAGVASVIASDYDHEGDLDLVLAGSFGVRLWRNDSALERPKDGPVVLKKARFTDASKESGLPFAGDCAWIVAEDFDGDNDVDFLTRVAVGTVVLDSLRDGKFGGLVGGRIDVPATLLEAPVVADFDGDARPDLWYPGEKSTLALRGHTPEPRGAAKPRPGSLVTTDLDLDGALDVLWLDEADGRLRGILALGLAEERALAVADPVPAGDRLAAADFDGDCRVDLAVESNGKLRIFTNASEVGHGARFAWKGLRDNRRAVGAVLELRAGAIYRRVYWRGEPEIVGLGKATTIDVFRLTWPNGVQNTRLDSSLDGCAVAMDPAEALGVMTQGDGQVGSCPFLYAWNGNTYGFVSDVLGTTPLGLRMAPGMFVPPDHDEYVLVTGEQLQPKDGALTVQMTEELREVTYLDHARLLVVDSPAGTEIYPNERFQFPPFPTHHVHTVREPLAPISAKSSDGTDCAAALARVDDVFPQPMELHPAQFAGLAKPWFVELAFDPARVRGAKQLRLVMTGWFYWSDASANMAAARSEGVTFLPPMFQVPDGKGGWRDTGPPVGFPAGKTKTMIVDVAPFLDRADPRIRVVTTLRLYWDRVVLAVDGDDAPIEVRELACTNASSWRRGFSTPLDSVQPGEAHPGNRPERFDWSALTCEPRWNQHPGTYTRYGPCTELLTVSDDRFLILGAGDAATLSFAAKDLAPPAPGRRRDYLLYLDGWAKDRDPNTIEALNVEPLPFHGMSGYPYRADEQFPDDETHRAWRRDWLTRPAFDWIAPISPRREVEWIVGTER